MAETASLLASASYEQPQSQLQHYQVKLTEHLADPTQPLDLEMEGLDSEGQAAEAEPSPSAGRPQFSGLTDTPPRTPSQDAAGRAARAKRVASSREVCLLCCAVQCCAVLCRAVLCCACIQHQRQHQHQHQLQHQHQHTMLCSSSGFCIETVRG